MSDQNTGSVTSSSAAPQDAAPESNPGPAASSASPAAPAVYQPPQVIQLNKEERLQLELYSTQKDLAQARADNAIALAQGKLDQMVQKLRQRLELPESVDFSKYQFDINTGMGVIAGGQNGQVGQPVPVQPGSALPGLPAGNPPAALN